MKPYIFYEGIDGITRTLQQHNNALEFRMRDISVQSDQYIYEVRRYCNGVWELCGKVSIKTGRFPDQRAVFAFKNSREISEREFLHGEYHG